MQIHEITAAQLTEAIASNLAQRVGGAVAGAKGLGQRIAQPFQQARQAYTQAQVGARSAGLAGKAQTAWQTYVQNLQATQQATPQVLEQSLRAFIQKNLLGDLRYQYNNLNNVDQIETVLKQIIDPANAQRQGDLWTQLVRTIGVSQAGGQAPVGSPTAKTKTATAVAPTAGVGANPADIARAIQSAGVDPKVYANIGKVLRQAGGTGTLPSTGNSVVDAFLRSLGYTIQ